MPTHIKRRALRACDGTALLVVLIVLLAIAAWSSSFVWLMNQQLTRAGARHRSAAALAVAEAGVHRALSILEGVAPDADRKSTRLNSSHEWISYAVFCLKKKNKTTSRRATTNKHRQSKKVPSSGRYAAAY